LLRKNKIKSTHVQKKRENNRKNKNNEHNQFGITTTKDQMKFHKKNVFLSKQNENTIWNIDPTKQSHLKIQTRFNRSWKIQRGNGILNKYGKISCRHHRWWLHAWAMVVLCERAVVAAQGAMMVVRVSDNGSLRSCLGCEGATLVARGATVTARGSGTSGSKGSRGCVRERQHWWLKGWLQNEEEGKWRKNGGGGEKGKGRRRMEVVEIVMIFLCKINKSNQRKLELKCWERKVLKWFFFQNFYDCGFYRLQSKLDFLSINCHFMVPLWEIWILL